MKSYIEIKIPQTPDERAQKLVKALVDEFPGFEIRSIPSDDERFHAGAVYVAPGHGGTNEKGEQVLGGAYLQSVQRIILKETGDWL